ncbi:23S ribosomal RNA methyltransferase Erm [Saccharopolyspora sp. HNM0986]|uniref:23S ribosomal RNA methyltransferase Erm n=1 Tax=Saccharopolyspora galaxeae TaxID=2781241 RepID=UPI00190BA46C|nr:23S ribosomal RNA methyltransferase Erm [Saccharopolyspora sp. HNM0986]MBK0865251.1 23S ribosomal RNA methyltransferase Erm [Saccharopolyspora sp. HNM0986]
MPSRTSRASRELGQNFLIDPQVPARVLELLDPRDGRPLVELGAGGGALTGRLAATGHPVTAVELDPRWAARLRGKWSRVRVVRCDMLRFRFPAGPFDVVGNLPYGLTTAMTRRLLDIPAWRRAVLLVQWDVARKRGVGGSMLNAQWAPWYEFRLHDRIPARAFHPRPAVDGGLLRIDRRPDPALPFAERGPFQDFVEAVFTGRGHGIGEIVHRNHGRVPRWLPAASLPRDLTPESWSRLYLELRRAS